MLRLCATWEGAIILHKENPSGLQKPLMRHHYSTAGLQGTYGHQDMILTKSPPEALVLCLVLPAGTMGL